MHTTPARLALLGLCLTATGATASHTCRQSYTPPPVYYQPATPVTCTPPPPPTDRCTPLADTDGNWVWRQQRVWVPGRWVPYISPYTGSRYAWQSAHYEVRWVRTWLPRRR